MLFKPDADGGSRWRFPLLAGTLVLAAFLLRIYCIGDPELWIDEAFSFYMATLKTNLGHALVTEYNPPLYYLLLRLWVGVAGTSEAALRFPSAIFGTLSVATVIWAGVMFFNRRIGLWAGAFTALAPIHIYYSQEARTYTLEVLLLLLTYVLLWRAMDRDTWPSWVLVSVTAALAIYSHYFGAIFLVPTAVLVWCRQEIQDRSRMWWRYGTATAAVGLMVMPWIALSFAFFPHAPAGWEWMIGHWQHTPPSLAVPKTLEVLGLGSQAGFIPPLPKVYAFVSFPGWVRILGLTVLVLLGVWAVVPWWDNRLQISYVSQRRTYLLVMLFFPLVAMWLISFYLRPIYFVGRYDFFVFPAYALLIGLGLAKFQSVHRYGMLLVLSLASALFFANGYKVLRYYEASASKAGGEISRLTARALYADVRDGDEVIFTGLRGMRTLYYLDRSGVTWSHGVCEDRATGRRFACRFYPREVEEHPGVLDERRVKNSWQAVKEDVLELLTDLQPSGQLWLVLNTVVIIRDEEGHRGEFGSVTLKDYDRTFVDVLRNLGYHLIPTSIFGLVFVDTARVSPG